MREREREREREGGERERERGEREREKEKEREREREILTYNLTYFSFILTSLNLLYGYCNLEIRKKMKTNLLQAKATSRNLAILEEERDGRNKGNYSLPESDGIKELV